MYGFKEKAKYLNELLNPAAAEADLSLLQVVAVGSSKLDMFARNPQRYANEILYMLLDFKSNSEIRMNRRDYEKKKNEDSPEPSADTITEDTVEEVEPIQEEKKKVPSKADPKSKNTKNTQKSTGKTSKTKVSK